MSKSQKRIIDVRVQRVSPYDFECTLASLKEQVEQLITEWGPDAKLDWDPHHYEPYDHDPSPQYNVYVRRLETDEEFNKRTESENKRKQEQDARELAEYNRLQAKFGAKK